MKPVDCKRYIPDLPYLWRLPRMQELLRFDNEYGDLRSIVRWRVRESISKEVETE
jgi:hypothetical protein